MKGLGKAPPRNRHLFVAWKARELHRWLHLVGHDGRCGGDNRPVEVSSMAGRLCFEERVRIEEMVGAGLSCGEAAVVLGRHPTTVQREVARYGGRGAYRAGAAQLAADGRAVRPRACKLAADAGLARAVAEGLAQRWSPHAVSADLRDRGLWVCAETIYRACYSNDSRSGLARGSWAKLPRRRRRRRPRGRLEQARRSALGRYRPLADRPAEADSRKEPGHWEGDLVVGRANQTAVATLVERASRHTLVVGLPGGYDAHNTAQAVTAALARQPPHMVKTLTWDTHNGGALSSGRV